jgi:hypothetical protein
LEDGHITYEKLRGVLDEGVAGYARLYSYGTAQCKFPSELIGRAIINLETFKCPSSRDLKPEYNCGISCHKFHNVSCATRNAKRFTNG